jgi:hypothetical protein
MFKFLEAFESQGWKIFWHQKDFYKGRGGTYYFYIIIRQLFGFDETHGKHRCTYICKCFAIIGFLEKNRLADFEMFPNTEGDLAQKS